MVPVVEVVGRRVVRVVEPPAEAEVDVVDPRPPRLPVVLVAPDSPVPPVPEEGDDVEVVPDEAKPVPGAATSLAAVLTRSRPLPFKMFPALRGGGASKSPGGIPLVAADMNFSQIWAGIPPPLTGRPRTRSMGRLPSSGQPIHTAVVSCGLAV